MWPPYWGRQKDTQDKGVFAWPEVEPDGVRLDNGMRLKNQELLRAPGRATQLPTQLPGLPSTLRPDLEATLRPPVRRRLTGHKLQAAAWS